MFYIAAIRAREILDSRGFPTVEASVELSGGAVGTAAVPSGASTGSGEALELRDGGDRFMGRGVLGSVQAIDREIAPALVGMDARRQAEVDACLNDLDGTPSKSRLGANSILAVSLAVARAGALSLGLPLYRHLGGMKARLLPVPQLNVLNGGAHADNNLDFQEFMIVPAGAQTFAAALQMGVEVYHSLKTLLSRRDLRTSVGDEGGFAPNLKSHDQALRLLVEAIQEAGYEAGRDVFLAVDAAASEFYRDGLYQVEGRKLDAGEMVDLYRTWVDSYPLVSIEDGLAEDDWEGWGTLTRELGSRVQLVGDDLFVTNTVRLTRGVAEGAGNSLLVKPNQIGSLTETIQAVQMAHLSGFTSVISHRSGETEDTFIADLAVGLTTGQIKSGAPARSERTAKYNRLLAIEAELGSEAVYGGLGSVLRLE